VSVFRAEEWIPESKNYLNKLWKQDTFGLGIEGRRCRVMGSKVGSIDKPVFCAPGYLMPYP